MKIVVASKNKGKAKEIHELLQDLNIEILTLNDINFDADIEETGNTFEENAIQKAETIASLCNEITLADDSGLEVDALNGAPGIYSARYAGEGASDQDKNNKLLIELENVPMEKRTARFVCVVALKFPDGPQIVVRGECEGRINFKPVGENGFGYDPLFFVPEYGMTMAEMDESFKNKISHRAMALKKLKEELTKLNIK